MFLIYIDDLLQSSLEYGCDDRCIFCKGKRIHKIEDILNEEFPTFCKSFVDNKLSIYFGKGKTKFIIFSKTKRSAKLNIFYRDYDIKQYHTVKYLGCHLDLKLSGESQKVNIKIEKIIV